MYTLSLVIKGIRHYDIISIIYIIFSIPKHFVCRYNISIIRIQHVQSTCIC